MKHERYIINDAEIALLEKYEGTLSQTKDPHRYDTFDKKNSCRLVQIERP